jgi:hypothetical protein
LYVYEYSSGNFDDAKRHVVKAIEIMKELVPSNHLMLASAKRVQALILEEQALEVMASQQGRGNVLFLILLLVALHTNTQNSI